MDPDLRIHIVGKRIRVRILPEIEKFPVFFLFKEGV